MNTQLRSLDSVVDRIFTASGEERVTATCIRGSGSSVSHTHWWCPLIPRSSDTLKSGLPGLVFLARLRWNAQLRSNWILQTFLKMHSMLAENFGNMTHQATARHFSVSK